MMGRNSERGGELAHVGRRFQPLAPDTAESLAPPFRDCLVEANDDGQQAVADWLRVALSAGRAAWPEVQLSDDSFIQGVRQRLCQGGPMSMDRLSGVHAADLYLAYACLARAPGAVDRLEREMFTDLQRHLRFVGRGECFVADVRQELMLKLLVKSSAGEPKLSTYEGRGPLATWIATAARRTAMSLLRRRGIADRPGLQDDVIDEADARSSSILATPENDYVRRRYGPQFRAAFQDALKALPVKERLIFRLHVLENVSLGKIARMYGVSQSTVSRWIAAAQQAVFAQVQCVLMQIWQVPAADLKSLINVFISQTDVGLSRLLRS